MSVGEIIAVVVSLIAGVASICAIATFAINKSKDKFNDGANDGSIKGDIKYMRNSFDDLSSTTSGSIILGAANIAMISAETAAIIAAKNWTVT